MAETSSAIDAAHFRNVLGHFPTGVTVVTGMSDDGPVGMAVGSFASVSLEPPLVAFFPGRGSGSWPRIEESGAFCVNVLGEDQAEICSVFASKGEDKFAGIGWKPTSTGSPRIDGVIAWIDCRIGRVDGAGDHFVVLGDVVELDTAAGGGPLLFFRGGYGRFAV